MVLTRRDEAVLKALCRFRLARTGDLLQFGFPGIHRVTATARIRRLYDGGFLEVRAGGCAEENIYALGPQGRLWASRQGLTPGRVPRGIAEHHLLIVRLWVALARAVKGVPDWRLERFLPDWEIRERTSVGPLPVIPDALVQLHLGARGRLRFVLEADRGTERLSQLQSKFQVYEDLRLQPGGIVGWEEFGLVVALAGLKPAHRQAVCRLVGERWGGWWRVWSDLDSGEDLLRSLVETPCTDSFSGSGRGVAVTAELATEEGIKAEVPSPTVDRDCLPLESEPDHEPQL